MGGFTGNPVIWLTIASPVSIANESIQRKTMTGANWVCALHRRRRVIGSRMVVKAAPQRPTAQIGPSCLAHLA